MLLCAHHIVLCYAADIVVSPVLGKYVLTSVELDASFRPHFAHRAAPSRVSRTACQSGFQAVPGICARGLHHCSFCMRAQSANLGHFPWRCRCLGVMCLERQVLYGVSHAYRK